MRQPSVVFVALATVGLVNAQGSLDSWHPAGPGDSRGPCPMLNTLANHGFLPHEGRNFTLPIIKHALGTGLNISDDLATLLHGFALRTNTADKNATTWGLDTLGNHNILEHDASLSRSDNFFTNDSNSFNSTIFDETRSYWTSDLIDVQMVANARLARMLDSVKYNPMFALSDLAGSFSAGEGAAYLMVFGNMTAKTARRDFVEYFFENERLPTELGWTIPGKAISEDDLGTFSNYVYAATSYEAIKDKVGSKRRS